MKRTPNSWSERAQVSVEFIMTYGWALLAVAGIIGVLSYYGFSDINSRIPSTCNFGTSFPCDNFAGITNGTFAFELKNMERAPINITGLYCDFGDSNYTYKGFSSIVGVGNTAIFYCNSSAAKVNGTFSGKNKFLAKVYFHFNEEDALPKVVSGEIIVPASSSSSLMDSYIANATNLG